MMDGISKAADVKAKASGSSEKRTNSLEASSSSSSSNVSEKEGDKKKGRLKRSLSERFRSKHNIDQIVPPSSVDNQAGGGPLSPSSSSSPDNEKLHLLIKQNAPLSKIQKLTKKAGIDINLRDKDLQTPLHIASTAGNIDLMKLLLKRGCDPNLQDSSGFTPLHCTTINSKLEACRLLLQCKTIRVDLTNVEKTSVLHYLVRIQVTDENYEIWEEILELMVLKGIDVNARNRHGESPLHSALLKSNQRAIMSLLSRNGDPNLRNSYDIKSGILSGIRSNKLLPNSIFLFAVREKLPFIMPSE